jgi:hypothetical protein
MAWNWTMASENGHGLMRCSDFFSQTFKPSTLEHTEVHRGEHSIVFAPIGQKDQLRNFQNDLSVVFSLLHQCVRRASFR